MSHLDIESRRILEHVFLLVLFKLTKYFSTEDLSSNLSLSNAPSIWQLSKNPVVKTLMKSFD
jgi:hypothetical protein